VVQKGRRCGTHPLSRLAIALNEHYAADGAALSKHALLALLGRISQSANAVELQNE
jgi:hypothetical protein